MVKQYDITVFGRVQGVGFRYAATNQARSLRLKGKVQNNPDGSVNAVIQGEEKSCNRFIHWCRTGPGYSWVERVDVREQEPEDLPGFTIIY